MSGNHEHWENLAAFHGTGDDSYYHLDALRAGATLMGEAEQNALARAFPDGLNGLAAAHLQCHLGCDAITMARAGASVTAIDFSATALQRVSQLADECGVAITTVESDSRHLPASLNDSFDLVYASIGVLPWIDDLDAWMSSVSRVLRPGGQLVLVEIHPVHTMFDTATPPVADFPYNFDGPRFFSGTGTYANRDADIAWETDQYAHGLAEVVMASLRAGLTLTYLEEHLYATSGMGHPEYLEADGKYRIRVGHGANGQPAEPLPMLYTLLARKP